MNENSPLRFAYDFLPSLMLRDREFGHKIDLIIGRHDAALRVDQEFLILVPAVRIAVGIAFIHGDQHPEVVFHSRPASRFQKLRLVGIIHLKGFLRKAQELRAAAGGLLLIYPGTLTDVIGLAVVGGIMGIMILREKKSAVAAA